MSKALTATLVLVGCAVACACATAPTGTETPGATAGAHQAETRVTLAVGQTVTLAGIAADITLVDVTNDSRCPADANCVWAGDATVTIRVRPASGPAETVALHANGPEGSTGTAAGLRLVLERLDPLPTAGQAIPRDRYRVAIAIFE